MIGTLALVLAAAAAPDAQIRAVAATAGGTIGMSALLVETGESVVVAVFVKGTRRAVESVEDAIARIARLIWDRWASAPTG